MYLAPIGGSGFTNWWTWVSVGCSQILTEDNYCLLVDLVSSIGGHEFQWDGHRPSLYFEHTGGCGFHQIVPDTAGF